MWSIRVVPGIEIKVMEFRKPISIFNAPHVEVRDHERRPNQTVCLFCGGSRSRRQQPSADHFHWASLNSPSFDLLCLSIVLFIYFQDNSVALYFLISPPVKSFHTSLASTSLFSQIFAASAYLTVVINRTQFDIVQVTVQ